MIQLPDLNMLQWKCAERGYHIASEPQCSSIRRNIVKINESRIPSSQVFSSSSPASADKEISQQNQNVASSPLAADIVSISGSGASQAKGAEMQAFSPDILQDVLTDSRQVSQKASGEVSAEPEKEWTILHYGAADNNLEKYWIANLKEMEAVGSGDNLNIVSQLDLRSIGCKRYYISKDTNSQSDTLTSPVIQNLGEVNMADPSVLSDFIAYGMKKYPAKHYMLIMASHGIAWEGLQLEESFFGGTLSVPGLRRSIENAEKDAGRKLDLLACDACLMGSAEAAYELKDTAHYMVASEQVEAFNSWPYKLILQKAFEEKKNVTPEELGSLVISESAGVPQDMPTMGLIDLSKMEEVKNAAKALAEQILVTKTSISELKAIARNTQKFYLPVKDMYHFAQQIAASPSIDDKKLVDAAKSLLSSIESAVVNEEHSTSVPPRELITDPDILAMSDRELKALYELRDAHGLNVELNPRYSNYDELQFAKDTQWASAMHRIG